MIRLSARHWLDDDMTLITVVGNDEASVVNILTARLQNADYEVLIEDADGTLISYEDYESA